MLASAVTAFALAHSASFPPARLPALDLYLSNFAEAEFTATRTDLSRWFELPMLKFAHLHAVWNDKGAVLVTPNGEADDGFPKYLSSAEIREISRRYFGVDPADLQFGLQEFAKSGDHELDLGLALQQARRGRLAFSGLEPQSAKNISRAFRVAARPRGEWMVDAVEYEAGNPRGARSDYSVFRCMTYIIGPNRYDSRRWAMKSAERVSRSVMERRLGVTNFRIPRWTGP